MADTCSSNLVQIIASHICPLNSSTALPCLSWTTYSSKSMAVSPPVWAGPCTVPSQTLPLCSFLPGQLSSHCWVSVTEPRRWMIITVVVPGFLQGPVSAVLSSDVALGFCVLSLHPPCALGKLPLSQAVARECQWHSFSFHTGTGNLMRACAVRHSIQDFTSTESVQIWLLLPVVPCMVVVLPNNRLIT